MSDEPASAVPDTGSLATRDAGDIWVGTDRFATQQQEDIDAAKEQLEQATPHATRYDERDERPKSPMASHKHYQEGLARRRQIMELVSAGMMVGDAVEQVGIHMSTYRGYREKYPKWAAELTVRRMAAHSGDKLSDKEADMGPAEFVARYFHMGLTWFQLLFMQEIEKLPKGNMLLVLWPPEHGKTTTFENYANRKLAYDPTHRFLVASENRGIAQKILGRVMDRMNPMGPTPEYVSSYGPFIPQTGGGLAAVRQPWTDTRFSVYNARLSDERNYSMEAVGINGSIVSARCDHFHVDDPQSVKTLGQSEKMTIWLRQDGLSRPAEEGITTICGTRVGDGDIYEELLQDEELDGIMKVLRFPAVVTDHDTGEQKPLDPSRHTLESLDRMRRKVGNDIWDRNWMQEPGASRKGRGTFTKEIVEKLLDTDRSLHHFCGDNGENKDPIVYIGVDPALGGKNVIMAFEVLPEGKLIPRKIREDVGLERNEQIMSALESVVQWCQLTAQVTDVVIEDKNFQLGLKNDDRLTDMAKDYGFAIRGHTTGWDKHDPDIGVASMASSLIKGELILPWAADDLTRHEIGQFIRQFYAWKPGVRGNKLRQDYVMAYWFVWMLWRSRHKSIKNVGGNVSSSFQRQTPGWKMSPAGLVLPNQR